MEPGTSSEAVRKVLAPGSGANCGFIPSVVAAVSVISWPGSTILLNNYFIEDYYENPLDLCTDSNLIPTCFVDDMVFNRRLSPNYGCRCK